LSTNRFVEFDVLVCKTNPVLAQRKQGQLWLDLAQSMNDIKETRLLGALLPNHRDLSYCGQRQVALGKQSSSLHWPVYV